MKRIAIFFKDIFSIKDIYLYLTKKEKLLVYSLFICLLISSIAELIGIASIIPLVEIIKDPINIDNFFIKIYLNFISNITSIQRVNIAIISSILLVVFAYSARLFSQFYIYYTSTQIGIFLHDKALKNYLNLPYDKQLGKITNDLPYCLTKGLTDVTQRIIFRWLNAISSFILFLFLSAGLLFAEPRITILFTISTFFYYLILNVPFAEFLSQRSKRMQAYAKDHLKSLSGLKWFIKQLKLYGIEEKYFHNIAFLNRRSRELNIINNFFTIFPRTLLEFLLIIIIISIISFNTQLDIVNFTPKILFCFLILQKLLPLFTSLYISFKDLIEKRYALKDLLIYLKIPYEKSNININVSRKNISNIEINNISFGYPNQKKFVLSEVSLSIDIKKYYFLIARSGYGKSTLIDLILGLQKPNKGKIFYKGVDFNKNASEIITGQFFAYVPQVNYFNDGILKDILRSHHYGNQISDADIYKACKTAELGSLIDSNGDYLSIYCTNNLLNFSGGQRQRFAIAQALIHPNLRMIFLDETLTNIDKNTCKKILENIKNNYPSIGVFIISHDEKFIPDYYQKIMLENINKIK